MAYHFAFLPSFTALIFCIQLTRTLGVSVSDGPMKLAELRPTTEKSVYDSTRNAEIHQIMHSIKEVSEMVKEKQRVDETNMFQMSIELQLLNLNLRLQDIEHQISKGEQTGTFGKNKIEPAQDNDLQEESRLVDSKVGAAKNAQLTNTCNEDVEKSLRLVRSTQEILLKEVRKQGVFQIQLATSINELKRNLQPDWRVPKQNLSTSSQRFSDDPNINTSIQTIAEQLESVRLAMNECVSTPPENEDEIKPDLANMITSFEEGITDEIKKLNTKSTQQLKSVDKLLKGHETLKKNYHAIQQYGQTLEDKVMSALKKLSDKIDDKTEGLISELNCLLKNEFQLTEKKILEKQIRCAKHSNAGDLQNRSDQQRNERVEAAESRFHGSTKFSITSPKNIPSNSSQETGDVFEQMEDNNAEELQAQRSEVG